MGLFSSSLGDVLSVSPALIDKTCLPWTIEVTSVVY
jgi:hypothetical protein